MPSWISEDDLTVAPLSDDERAWIRKLDNLFKTMPSRLKLLESADSLSVIDEAASHDVELCDGGAGVAGIELATLNHATMKITSASA